jgi:sugar/nucleoside kinase (ribokinase family)
MSTDVVVATPTFLDLTFVGLEALPTLGQERFAGNLVRSPGGGGITAVAASRLGLATALAAPLGEDEEGALVRAALADDGVALVDRRCPHTPVTVVMPAEGDRAMVTVDPGIRANADDVAGFAPRAVVANLDQLYCVPDGAAGYITCGDEEARAFARRPPAGLSDVRALFVSEQEALALTGADSAADAAERLAGTVETLVVTCGARGATSISAGGRTDAPAVDAGPVVDTTGAGDLLVAAYIWADLRGASPEDRLRWAVLYAGLSVTRPTAVGGAVSETRLIAEGTARGLTVPGGAGSPPG